MSYEVKYVSIANAIVWGTVLAALIAVGGCHGLCLIAIPGAAVFTHIIIVLSFRERPTK